MPSSRGSTTARRRNNLNNTASSRPPRPLKRQESVGSTTNSPNTKPSRNKYVKSTYKSIFNKSPTDRTDTLINKILNNAPPTSRQEFIKGMTKYNKPGKRIGFVEIGGSRFRNYLQDKQRRNANKPVKVGPVYFQSKSRGLKTTARYVELALDIKKTIKEILYSKNQELSNKTRQDLRKAFDKFSRYMLQGPAGDPELKEQRKKKLWEIIRLFINAPTFDEFMGGDEEAKIVRLAVSNPSTTISAVSAAISSGDVSSIAGAVVTQEVSKRAPRAGQIIESVLPYVLQFARGGSIQGTLAQKAAGKVAGMAFTKYRTYRSKQKQIKGIRQRVNIPSTINRKKALMGYARLFNYVQNPNINTISPNNVINYMYGNYKGNWSQINKSSLTRANKNVLSELVNRAENNMWRDMGAR
jgi:hypothetical protein